MNWTTTIIVGLIAGLSAVIVDLDAYIRYKNENEHAKFQPSLLLLRFLYGFVTGAGLTSGVQETGVAFGG